MAIHTSSMILKKSMQSMKTPMPTENFSVATMNDTAAMRLNMKHRFEMPFGMVFLLGYLSPSS